MDHPKVWRYMDFTKFVSMLDSSKLHFSRLDKLQDNFEGSFAHADRERFEKETGSAIGPDSDWQEYIATRDGVQFRRRSEVWVNCWHVNEGESAAMWSLYGQRADAIAVRSTVGLLALSLPNVPMGFVQYIDYASHELPIADQVFFYKRKSFAHEQELRAVLLKDKHPIADGGGAGQQVTVDLHKLVQAVFVAPTAPTWFAALVRRVINRYGYEFPVDQSALDSAPIY